MIVIPFHVGGLDAIVRMIRRYTYPKGEAISDRTYNTGSVGPLVEPPRKPFAPVSLGLALVVVAGLQDDEVVPIDEIDQPMLVVNAP